MIISELGWTRWSNFYSDETFKLFVKSLKKLRSKSITMESLWTVPGATCMSIIMSKQHFFLFCRLCHNWFEVANANKLFLQLNTLYKRISVRAITRNRKRMRIFTLWRCQHNTGFCLESMSLNYVEHQIVHKTSFVLAMTSE